MRDENGAITLIEKNDLKKNQAMNGIRTHDLWVSGAILHQPSYQSHTRAVVRELYALYAFASIFISLQ